MGAEKEIDREELKTVFNWLLGFNVVLTVIMLVIVVHFTVTRFAKLERKLFSAVFFTWISLLSVAILLTTILLFVAVRAGNITRGEIEKYF